MGWVTDTACMIGSFLDPLTLYFPRSARLFSSMGVFGISTRTPIAWIAEYRSLGRTIGYLNSNTPKFGIYLTNNVWWILVGRTSSFGNVNFRTSILYSDGSSSF